ncbi:MAG: hypothetical protein ACFFAN_05915 [Promethearchaeota archaeon]
MFEINKENPRFKTLTNLIIQRLAQTKKKFNSKQLDFLREHDIILEPKTYQNLGFSDEDDKIINLLKELIQIPEEKRLIRFSLDSRFFTLQIGDLYDNLMNLLLSSYLMDEHSISEKLFLLLREFSFHFEKMIIPYKILIPLKGININRKSSEKIQNLVFVSKESSFQNIYASQIEIKIFRDFRIIRKDFSIIGIATETHNSKKDEITHTIGLLAKSFIPFENPPRKFPPNQGRALMDFLYPKNILSLKNNPIWKELKNIYASFLVFNQKIRYGRPFYIFPWWISKETSRFFEFPRPSWMLKTDFTKQHSSQSSKIFEELIIADLIPDFDRFSTFILPYQQLVRSSKGDMWTSETGIRGLGRDPRENYGFQRYNLIFKQVQQNYQVLSNKGNSINFEKDTMIFDRLIRLRQREYVEDAIMDGNLILEALLIPEPYEFSYRFRLYASILTMNSLEDGKKTEKYFKNLYLLRSLIVHGGDWSKVYKKFVKLIVSYDIDKYSNKELIEKTNDDVIDSLFQKIVIIIGKIIEIQAKFPDYLLNIDNLLKLIKKIKDK